MGTQKMLICGVVFTGIGIGCMLMAFASPYWVESFSMFQGQFTKIGLWEVCFDDYTFYKDYNGKRYLGCWWIFSPQIRPIWEWLSPPWFISCQVMVSITLLLQVLNGILVALYLFKLFPQQLRAMILLGAAGTHIGTLASTLLFLIVFGIFKEDRQWVPRPDMNFLSWSYGFACLAGISMIISAITLFKASRRISNKDRH